MPESFYDTVVVLYFTVIPLVLILLHVFFSFRKRIIWGFIIPVLWTMLGAWIVNSRYSIQMVIFFAGGDLILFSILALIRYMKNKKRK